MAGKWTSVDLVNVFASRCYKIGRALCLTTEEDFEYGLKEAEIKDKEREEALRNGTQLPILHGIPVSVKELNEQKGKLVTVGCQHLCEKVFEEDNPTIKLIKDAGAIIIVRGNVPQLAFAIHSENMVWGEARNPHNQGRSCGGSSGGDGGLVAAKCVPLAFGSDIGGSIRIPAHFNGIRGLRPSPWRISMLGHRTALYDNAAPLKQIRACSGPLGQTSEDIKIGLQVLINDRLNHYDPFVPPLPFRDDLYERASSGKVRIGYFESIENQPTTVAMKRALNIAKDALEAQGYELVRINLPTALIEEAREVFVTIIMNFCLGPMIKKLDENYERPLPCYKFPVLLVTSGFFVKNLLYAVLRLTGNNRIYKSIKSIKICSKDEINELFKRQADLYPKVKEFWDQQNIEAILQPSYLSCSFKHEHSGDMGIFFDYLNLWSLLHYPVGVVPVSSVQDGEDAGYEDGINDEWTKIIRKDMVGTVGMPISVSIVAQPWQDEIIVGIMKALDDKIKYKKALPAYLME
ncbi:hypothetical protein FGO68_gene10665 [Halteria grandinella]|uniref:Amidase domain-containing protein n=1 Tax=Halteria grandinella TaxID=5974 RepID=A0A8J8T4C3_HALGN|nr:hypothetical protein FGO68_gene10665 [Halteria grandinella]